MPEDDSPDDRGGLEALSDAVGSDDVKRYYDDWAAQYNHDLAAWGYEAPAIGAGLLASGVAVDGSVLDVGCGTGLTGLALRDAGFTDITGVDISQSSLDLAAQTGAYAHLDQVDLHQLPLSLNPDAFAGLQCIGVLTYVPETDAVLREFCRLVEPSGRVVISQRDDLFAERRCDEVLRNLEADRTCTVVSVSEPAAYLPENEEFGESINVIFVVLEVL